MFYAKTEEESNVIYRSDQGERAKKVISLMRQELNNSNNII